MTMDAAKTQNTSNEAKKLTSNGPDYAVKQGRKNLHDSNQGRVSATKIKGPLNSKNV